MTESALPAIDDASFRTVLGHYPTGVCVVSSINSNGGLSGMVVGSFASVSLSPPLVAFLPAKSSTTWPRIEAAGKFCVNVLACDQLDLCARFSAKTPDKFDGVSHRLSGNGSPVLDKVVAWIDCTLEAVHEAGDHFIVVGRVGDMAVERPEQPLLFFRGQYGRFAPHDRAAGPNTPVVG